MTTEAMQNESARSFYVTGGTLQLDAPSYVARQADKDLFSALQEGQLCYMLTSRQMGKSSLMVRTATRLREAKCHVAVIDLTEIGQNLSVEQWYYGLLCRFGDQVDLEDDLIDYWREHKLLGPMQRWISAIREVAMPRIAGRIIIFVDEIDAVLSLKFSTDEFFAGIRECFNHRTQDKELERLTFCLLGVATPSDLIQDPRTTPFNIGRRIELADFTLEEAHPLAEGLSADPQIGKRLLRRVLSWTGGQPYLTQRLCRALSECRGALTLRDVDKQCEELFLTRKARETDDNLAFVRNRLLRSDADIAALLDMYAQARNRWLALHYDATNPMMAVLRLSGIVRVVNGRLYVRNGIYFRVFDREWIRANMPNAELQRQRKAYWKGVALAATVFAFILVGVGFAVATIHRERKNAVSAADAAREEKTRAEKEKTRAEENEKEAIASRNQTRSLLYIADMNLAQRELENLNIDHAREILDKEQHNPEVGFEWGYLDRQRDLSLGTIPAHNAFINSIALSHDGNWLLTGSKDNKDKKDTLTEQDDTAKLWNTKTRQLKRGFNTRQNVTAVAFASDNKHLAIGEATGVVALWSIDGQTPFLLPKQPDEVTRLDYTPNGQWLAVGNKGGGVQIWDVGRGKQLRALTLDGSSGVAGMAFLPDGRHLLTGAEDGVAQIWDVTTGHKSVTLPYESGDSAYCVAASPDGKRVAVGYEDKTARIFDAKTGKEEMAFLRLRHKAAVLCMAFSPNSKWLVTGSNKNVARVWDVATHRQQRQFAGHTRRVTGVAFSPEGLRLYSGSGDGMVKIWDAAQERQSRKLTGHTSGVRSLAFSPDSKWLVTGSDDNTARVWNAQTGTSMALLRGHTGLIQKVVFSPDGRRIATGSDDMTAKIWDSSDGKLLFTLSPGDGEVFAIAYSPDGKLLATAGKNGMIRLWEPDSGKFLRVLTTLPSYPTSLAFSPNSRLLLCGSVDGTARLYDVVSGMETRVLKQHTDHVSSVAFSADGSTMATGSDDGTAVMWDVATGEELSPPLNNGVAVEGVAFSPDGKRLLTGDSDGHAKLWNTQSRQEVLMFNAHEAVVLCVAFSPDGRLMATGSADKTAKIWDGGRVKSNAVLKKE